MVKDCPEDEKQNELPGDDVEEMDLVKKPGTRKPGNQGEIERWVLEK